MEGSSPLETNPLAAIHPFVEEKTNIMTLEELDALRETYSFLSRVQVRLPEEWETITSARPSEVAFYEVSFLAGLRFPIHPTIKLILQFYNIYPAQLVPNAWRSIVCSMAMWRVFKYTLSVSEFRNLFSLNSNPKPDQSWLYFKARNKKTLLRGIILGGRPESSEDMGDKHCNNSPRLYGDELKVFEVFRFVEKTGHFSVPVLLESKSFCRVFVSLGSMASGTSGEGHPGGEPSSSRATWDRTEEDFASYPRPDPLEVVRGKGFRFNFNRNLSLGLNPTSDSSSDSSQPVELDSDAMSKRISFKKLGKNLEKSKNKSLGILASAKGSKGKRVDPEPKGKKKATSSSNASTTPATASSHPGEGTSANLGAALGPTAFILGSPSMAEKLLRGVIPPVDKEKVEKQTLDQMATKLFHVIGQALVLNLSLAVRSREAGEQASLQEGRAASMEIEVARLQKLSVDLEQQLAEARVREQQANDELAKTKSDRDSQVDKFERSGILVVELREALDKAKESAVEEFKSLSEFVVAVEDFASKYFGEEFNFCKVQLRRHHPNRGINFEGTMVDQDLLAEQDETAEEKEKEKAIIIFGDENLQGEVTLATIESHGV
ncbi:hypothetical protein Acr_05g0010000 [Actinidia rufa]|uniref:Transposase (putative) gypsy type domain-containing protein n=1 Tax=Actinidia rufa TaxID=165716 RepID=A0A7J0ELM4_9ERIC|nr:hypothetical protein Acr_05g0010000 [Actinidia rufa]